MKKKLRSRSGETLVETLVSILMIALAVAFLSVAMVSAAKVNASLQKLDPDFVYDRSQQKQERIVIQIDGVQKTVDESVYENNDYYFYGD